MKSIAFYATAFLVATVGSAQELTVNATAVTGTQRISPGTYSAIRVVNTLPAYDYDISTTVESHSQVVDIEKAREEAKKAFETQEGTDVAPECEGVIAATKRLMEATAEIDVPAFARQLRDKRAVEGASKCPAHHASTMALDLTTRRFDAHLVLEENDFASVKVLRLEKNGPKEIAQRVFDTGASGSIRTSVLFGVHANNDERWFAKKSSDTRFVITKEVDRDTNDPFGAVMFSYLPRRNTTGVSQLGTFKKGPMSGSWAVGVGFDSANPVYLAGYQFALFDSFGISLGYSGFNSTRLKGIYKGDGTDEVTESLQPDQLMNDTFDTDWFVGLTFRR